MADICEIKIDGELGAKGKFEVMLDGTKIEHIKSFLVDGTTPGIWSVTLEIMINEKFKFESRQTGLPAGQPLEQ